MGLLNKNNKNRIIDIDVTNMDEMDKIFTNHVSWDHSIIYPISDGLCIIHGAVASGPLINLFLENNGELYNVNIELKGLNSEAGTYEPHHFYIKKVEIPKVIFYNGSYLWKVDINDAKSFLKRQFELCNKIINIENCSDGSKLLEQWLGVDLDFQN